jgi:SAM-dependent methyltransferase
VAALDTSASSVTALLNSPAFPLCGNALSLPFADNSFDLVFCQCVLMWVTSTSSVDGTSTGLVTAVSEIHRVLEPNGVLIALEPDYAGMIEYPPEIATRDIWLSALARVGAEPRVGRMLPGVLAAQGVEVRVDLLDSLVVPESARFEFLQSLPLTADEASGLERAVSADARLGEAWQKVVHLPFFLISAAKV